jgi:hypothetical protein
VISPDQFGKDTKANKKAHRKGPAINPADVIMTATNKMCQNMAAVSGIYNTDPAAVIASLQANKSQQLAQQ